MAGLEFYGPSKNAKPVRKDQRFPPRYPGAQRPKGKGRGITAIQFVKKVAKTQLTNSRYVSIRSAQLHKTKPLIKTTTLTREPGQKPRIHTQRIYASDPNYVGKLSECPSLRVTCTCANLVTQWEVSLALHNAADIIYSDGSYPIIKNPNLRPGCCKHIFKVLMFMILKGL